MSNACGTVSADALIRSLVGMADCQVAALGGDGWHGLATSGLFAALLTGLLTLVVAREGYRLLGGGAAIAPADAVKLLVRVGLVIALSTSWQAYDRLIYRVAMEGPGELAGILFPAAGIETASLIDRLQNAYDAIDTVPEAQPAAKAPASAGAARTRNTEWPAGGSASGGDGLPGSGRHAAAGILAVVGAGSWIAARFALGLLLAVGPLAIVAWLFAASAGLFVGWLRALIGAALASLVIPMALSLELQALAGPVAAAARAGTVDVPGLGAIVWTFALVVVALIVAVQRVAGGLRLPDHIVLALPTGGGTTAAMGATPAFAASTGRQAAATALRPQVPERAQAIARAAQARVTEGARGPAIPLRSGGAPPAQLPAPSPGPDPVRGTQLIDSARRSAAGRRTVSGKRVDMRT